MTDQDMSTTAPQPSQPSLLSFRAESDVEYAFDEFLVKSIPLKTAREFFAHHHYSQGCGNAAMTWGLYHDPTSRLIGAIAFQTPISENTRKSIFELSCNDYDEDLIPSWNQCDCDHIAETHGYREHVTELHRLAIIDDAPRNTATWFISRALDRLKSHKPKYWAVISFADTTEGHDGTVYQAANADYYGTSEPRIAYIDEEGRIRPARQCGENISPMEARARGWKVVRQDTKHRYVFWTPDPYGTKDRLRAMSTVDLQPYPDDEDEGEVVVYG